MYICTYIAICICIYVCTHLWIHIRVLSSKVTDSGDVFVGITTLVVVGHPIYNWNLSVLILLSVKPNHVKSPGTPPSNPMLMWWWPQLYIAHTERRYCIKCMFGTNDVSIWLPISSFWPEFAVISQEWMGTERSYFTIVITSLDALT